MTFLEHVARRDNPHQVTKAQLGLGNIQNYPLATESEVRAMLRTDRYIDAANTAWIQSALLTYMQEKGLLDINGTLIVAPTDSLGRVTFVIDDLGVTTITGTHTAAKTVDVILTHPTISPLFQDNIAVIGTNWTFPTGSLNLDPNVTFNLDVIYRDIDGHQISKGHYTSTKNIPVDNSIFKFERYYDGSGLLSGITDTAVKIEVEVFEDLISVYTVTDIVVETNGYWEEPIAISTLDNDKTYTGVAKLYDSNDKELATYNSGLVIESIPDSSIIFTVDSEGVGTLYGSLPGLVNTEVTVTQDNVVVFTNDSIEIAPNGSWVADVSALTFDTSKPLAATLLATNINSEPVVLTTEPAVILPADLVVKMLYDSVRGAWYYDFGSYTDWTTIDPSTILFIDYGLIRNL